MHKLNAIVFFLGIALWSAPSLAQDVNVCSFDLTLMAHFVRGDLSEVPATLNFIRENAPKIRNENQIRVRLKFPARTRAKRH